MSAAYRERRDKSAQEIREAWSEAERAREQVLVQAARRDERAAEACRREAPWRWAEERPRDRVGEIFNQGMPGRAERKLVKAYRRYPETLRAELFPPLSVPPLPELPSEPENVERRWAELEAAQAAWSAAAEQIERDAERLEELKRSRRKPPNRLVVRANQARMVLEQLDQVDAAYDRAVDEGVQAYEVQRREGRKAQRVARWMLAALFLVLALLLTLPWLLR